MAEIDLSKYKSELSYLNKLKRFLWLIIWKTIGSVLVRKQFNFIKISLLKLFGAKIDKNVIVYSTAVIYQPWKLSVGENSVIGPNVDCYNVDWIKIGSNSVISQKTYLCTASHDITNKNIPLITSPIIIEDQVWIGASVFIGMGVKIRNGAVIGASSSLFKSVDSWSVYGGNPATFLKKRIIND